MVSETKWPVTCRTKCATPKPQAHGFIMSIKMYLFLHYYYMWLCHFRKVIYAFLSDLGPNLDYQIRSHYEWIFMNNIWSMHLYSISEPYRCLSDWTFQWLCKNLNIVFRWNLNLTCRKDMMWNYFMLELGGRLVEILPLLNIL